MVFFCGNSKHTKSRRADVTIAPKPREARIVLLGTAQSGKSTLRKQILSQMGKGFAEQDQRHFVSQIHFNILQSTRSLIQAYELAQVDKETHTVRRKTVENMKVVKTIPVDSKLDLRIGRVVYDLWRDSGFRRTANSSIPDSTSYYFDRLKPICKSGYVATTEDILRCYVKTTGIVEERFSTKSNTFRVVDVGGQRNERLKWKRILDSSDAIVMVVALSEFDQIVAEDNSTNRIQESVAVLTAIANNPRLIHLPIKLVFSKCDVLADKLRKVHLKDYFPQYQGPVHDVKAASEFLIRLYFRDLIDPNRVTVSGTTNLVDPVQAAHIIHALHLDRIPCSRRS
jgi:guanine nucleotide-binding protein subunit alpha-14